MVLDEVNHRHIRRVQLVDENFQIYLVLLLTREMFSDLLDIQTVFCFEKIDMRSKHWLSVDEGQK